MGVSKEENLPIKTKLTISASSEDLDSDNLLFEQEIVEVLSTNEETDTSREKQDTESTKKLDQSSKTNNKDRTQLECEKIELEDK